MRYYCFVISDPLFTLLLVPNVNFLASAKQRDQANHSRLEFVIDNHTVCTRVFTSPNLFIIEINAGIPVYCSGLLFAPVPPSFISLLNLFTRILYLNEYVLLAFCLLFIILHVWVLSRYLDTVIHKCVYFSLVTSSLFLS